MNEKRNLEKRGVLITPISHERPLRKTQENSYKNWNSTRSPLIYYLKFVEIKVASEYLERSLHYRRERKIDQVRGWRRRFL